MKRTEVSQNVYQYSFLSFGRSFSDNIFVVHNNGKAIIIDTAFEENAVQVRADLEKLKIKPEKVIISHLHDDHMMGNSVFKDCDFYVHPVFIQQKKFRDVLKNTFSDLRDINFARDGESLFIDDLELKIHFAPGHHISGLTVLIDNKIAFANDLIIYSNDNKMVIPYIDSGSTIDEHIASLNFLKNAEPDVLLAGHGPIIGKEEILGNIEQRVFYLKKLKEIGPEAQIEDCLLREVSNYSHVGFHFSNLQKVYKRVL